MCELVSAALAADAAHASQRAAAPEGGRVARSQGRHAPSVAGVSPRQPRLLHPIVIAAAVLIAFCGALYVAHGSGWSSMLLTRLDATQSTTGQALPPARAAIVRPAAASDVARGFAEYQRRMLETPDPDIAPAHPAMVPMTSEAKPPETAPEPDAPRQQAARPSEDDRARTARRATPKPALARPPAAPRPQSPQRNVWDAPGYTAR